MSGVIKPMENALIIGYGNPGRRDDGLGPAFAAELERLALPGLTVDSDYQLSVEDAETVSRHATVVFVDAAAEGPAPFSFGPLAPRAETSFTSHHLAPAAVLSLAGEAFGATPRAYLLGIRGYEFNEFREELSPGARDNLTAALVFFRGWMCQNQAETKLGDSGRVSGFVEGEP